MMMELERTTPEAVGIPGEAIVQCLDFLEQRELPVHSFLLLRHGKLAYETYYAPFERDTLHRMFSVTKSLVSLAVGLLEQEGKLSLDDEIAPYFRDLWPEGGLDEYTRQMTIREMLKMTSTHRATTYKIQKEHWVGSFFQLPGDHRSGDCFNYDTSSTHTLAALVERLTGQKLLEYLRLKCLNEIGFSKEAYCLADPQGVSVGGSGLMAKPVDLLRIGLLLLKGGRLNGKQLLPKKYLQEATGKQADTFLKGSCYEEKQGYGYQFWRTTHNGYAMFGMGGQLCVCLPEKDLVFVLTADTQGRPGGVQLLYDAFWTAVYPALSDHELPPASVQTLEALNTPRSLWKVQGSTVSPWMDKLESSRWVLDENAAGFTELELSLEGDEGQLALVRPRERLECRFGLGKQLIVEKPVRYGASAAWRDSRTLLICVQMIDEVLGNAVAQLTFGAKGITLILKKNVEYILGDLDGIISGRLA